MAKREEITLELDADLLEAINRNKPQDVTLEAELERILAEHVELRRAKQCKY